MSPAKLLRAAPLLLLSALGLVVCFLIACGSTDDNAESGNNALSNQQTAPGYGGSSGYGGYGGYGGSSGYGGYGGSSGYGGYGDDDNGGYGYYGTSGY